MDGWNQLQNTYLTGTEAAECYKRRGREGGSQGGFETLKWIPDREGGNRPIGEKT